MKRSKVFLFFFIFILLFSQQQLLQGANAQNLPSAGNFSSDQSLQNSGLPTTVIVYMLKVYPNGDKLGPYDYCHAGDGFSTGCVEQGSGAYPPEAPGITYDVICDPNCAKNPMRVDVEGYYLDNVLPREMNVAENTPTLPALKAQALAARSIAGWKPDNRHNPNFKAIDNSTDFQVFRPGSLDYYYPSAKSLIQQAVDETSGQYLYRDDGQVGDLHKLSIDAEFGSDALNTTFTDPSEYPKPYLTSVSDPISNNGNTLPEKCKAINNGNLEYPYAPFLEGMSQKGAIRWSLGNQCADLTKGNSPWSVTWTDYRQILAHYYTGIDILNASGAKVAPDDRWNLLKHNVPTQMNSGSPPSVEIWLQNTSTAEWTAGTKLGYQWVGTNIPWAEINLPAMLAGKDEKIQMNIIPPPVDGTYTLRFDVRRAGGTWFSEKPLPELSWVDVQISITVAGGSTPTPTITPTAIVTPIPSITCGFHNNWICLSINPDTILYTCIAAPYCNNDSLPYNASAVNFPLVYVHMVTGAGSSATNNFSIWSYRYRLPKPTYVSIRDNAHSPGYIIPGGTPWISSGANYYFGVVGSVTFDVVLQNTGAIDYYGGEATAQGNRVCKDTMFTISTDPALIYPSTPTPTQTSVP